MLAICSLPTLAFAPTIVPAHVRVVSPVMQEAAEAPPPAPEVATAGGDFGSPVWDAPAGLENELGATGPLGFWDPLGLVRGSPSARTLSNFTTSSAHHQQA